jgi:ribonuclease VapC
VSSCVLDASALCALLFEEPGHEALMGYLAEAYLSSVNLTEVLTKAVDRKRPLDRSQGFIAALSLHTVPFDTAQAAVAASIREQTRPFGLSLGDRACLALAIVRGLPVITADRDWKKTGLGVDVRVFR